MKAFQDFAVVDWSAGNDTGPTPRKDAIWVGRATDGVEAEPVYMRNREVAFEHLAEMIEGAQAPLMIGFDFPFGYPAGFAEAVVGSDDTLSLWAYVADALNDAPEANSRFALAGQLNGLFPGVGPFWFNGLKDDVPGLPRKGRAREGHGMGERRAVERLAKGAFSCWQVGGAGAVGGQVMTGIATLERLRRRFPGRISVWPFEPLDRKVAFVEIWPGLIAPAVKAANDDIRDRAQVRLLARALSRLPEARIARMLDVDAPEEGWIFGVGFEEELVRHAWPD